VGHAGEDTLILKDATRLKGGGEMVGVGIDTDVSPPAELGHRPQGGGDADNPNRFAELLADGVEMLATSPETEDLGNPVGYRQRRAATLVFTDKLVRHSLICGFDEESGSCRGRGGGAGRGESGFVGDLKTPL